MRISGEAVILLSALNRLLGFAASPYLAAWRLGFACRCGPRPGGVQGGQPAIALYFTKIWK